MPKVTAKHLFIQPLSLKTVLTADVFERSPLVLSLNLKGCLKSPLVGIKNFRSP
ncbi:hypothetical protein [Nostoc sp. CALU 546]|uniref:hypothetical protein n=1 Tax=Nostoc sp. CALU 546 TaxID=1867241 RepID=UPI003B673E3A